MFESFSSLNLKLPKEIIVSDSFIGLLISSVILITAILIIRALTARFIKQKIESYELRRRWLVQSRNGLILLMALGLIFIWGQELRTLALSVVAIAVAFVVATKELIMCVMGSILKTGAGSFTVGDRIQVKEFRGDVIDQNLLATTILEVGPGKSTHQRTGRLVVLPNAMFVAEPVINESYTNDYILHVFTVPYKREDDWQSAQKAFLQAANRHCMPYMKEVRNYMRQISQLRGVEVPSVEPRVTLAVPEADEIHLVVRIPARAHQRVQVEQAILSEALTGVPSPVEP
ncbi:mechanosensitive ion channel domain-containing protein [Methylophaga sp. OBS3]|uniref:mechanosensitive ion channel domain-containing protein n=1 Tax=Methylophaga sp. OBS3 TaxID=2991934 RepID=UPI0022544544|nr:mechanosensitive ion channel domain-containing protein [Methylophaga sp. OBS3]MCX4189598.1 mechanosensitive ion channel family protein [Methylophaga sp. OBS3]